MCRLPSAAYLSGISNLFVQRKVKSFLNKPQMSMVTNEHLAVPAVATLPGLDLQRWDSGMADAQAFDCANDIASAGDWCKYKQADKSFAVVQG